MKAREPGTFDMTACRSAPTAVNGLPPSCGDDSLWRDRVVPDIMEARQEMEDAIASGEPAQRKRVEEWVQQQRATYISEVNRLFEKILTKVGDDADADAQANVGGVRVQLNAWRYIERMIEQLDPAHELDL